jgi:hopene-associated glycosyltransferase HpnB
VTAALLSLVIWGYLYFAHGQFWRSLPELSAATPPEFPDLDIVVPARDEAESIAAAIGSLLAQDYAGTVRLILVDDNSSDGTVQLAGTSPRLEVLRLHSKPEGWSGKLWALSQGVAASSAPLVLFTDADIVHDPRHVATLVAELLRGQLDLVSEMVRLNCTSLAERALVPAFVYFFQMLYPFSRVNDAASATAAAAGGTILIRREALQRMGGIAAIRATLIDDVALAKAVKRNGGIYLGHSRLAISIRRYPRFADIWRMISRTAFTQLHHSAGLLVLTVLGLIVVWELPLGMALFGRGWAPAVALCACGLAALSYVPTLRRYGVGTWWVLALPLIALFYLAATVGSAFDYWCGKGANWKNRAYQS